MIGIIIFVIILVILTLKYCPYFSSSNFGSGPTIFNPDDKLTPFNFDNKFEPVYVKT